MLDLSLKTTKYKLPSIPFFDKINSFINSKWFVFFIAVFTLLNNVFGFDLFYFTTIAVIAVYVSIFGKDYLSYIPMMVFCYIALSVQNNPSKNPQSVLLPQNNGNLIYILAGALVFALLIRLLSDSSVGLKKAFKTKKTLTLGMVLLGITYLISGIGSINYSDFALKNVLFSLIQFLAMFVPYYLLCFAVKWDEIGLDYFAFVGVAFGLVVGLEIINVYAVNNVITDSTPNRFLIYTGWGVNNNMGAMLVMAIPFCFFYISKSKFVISNFTILVFLSVCVLLSCSRNAILSLILIYFICSVIVIITAKPWVKSFFLISSVMLIGCVFLIEVFFIKTIHISFLNGLNSDSRFDIYVLGAEVFTNFPVFGGGFYALNNALTPEDIGWNTFFPRMWHNTLIQILATGGLVCFIAYLVHNIQLVVLFTKKRSFENIIIFVSIFALLLLSFLDCYFFQLGPILFYSSSIAYAEQKLPHRIKSFKFEKIIYSTKRNRTFSR